MRLSFKKKIVYLGAGAAALPVVVMFMLLGQLERDVVDRASAGLQVLARTNVAQVTADVYGLCSMTADMLDDLLEQNEKASMEILYGNGAVTQGAEVAWTLVSDSGQDGHSLTLPAMQIGGNVFTPDTRTGLYSPVVDDIRRITGWDCTLFQRINQQGDMLRVASTLEHVSDKSRRAVGTVIHATDSDGALNPIIQTILDGKTDSRVEEVLGNTFLVSRMPVTNAAGEIVGMLGVGRKINAMDFLKKIIAKTGVGEKGYVWVIKSDGPDKGTAIISEEGQQDGQQLWDQQDAEGHYYVRDMLEMAAQKPSGEIQFERYVIRNPANDEYKTRIIAFTAFEPWHWVIGASAYEDAYYTLNEKIRDETRESLMFLAVAGLVLLVVSVILSSIIGRHIARPLDHINQVARCIAEGNIREAVQLVRHGRGVKSPQAARDEIGDLYESFEKMTDNLAGLLGQVQRSGIQVTTSTTEIAAASRQLEATAVEQAASTRAVSQTTQRISRTSESLVQTMDSVSNTADQTADMAETGREKLHEMQTVMQQLVKATSSISSKLAVINEKTTRISSVVTTINSISDQTNLLSLNAAIEAEKAGEHGRGFSVVAREITRLADQTATATQDIEYMVKEMQSSVSSGVMEMDKFGEEVRTGVREAAAIAAQLGSIIDQVRALGPQFEEVQGGMTEQVDGARQISETIEQLAATADQTRDALHEFQHVTEQLNTAVQGLQQEVSRFRIDA
jgi:methyl-accepting chemotaxis protein WspA